jgi:hypothetical protein
MQYWFFAVFGTCELWQLGMSGLARVTSLVEPASLMPY